MQERCAKPSASFAWRHTSTRSFRSITPFTTRGRTTPSSLNVEGNLSRTAFTRSSSAPIAFTTGRDPPRRSDVDDGFLLQRVLGRDKEDRDEPQEHRREQGDLGLERGRGVVGDAVHHERPQDEEHGRDVEHDEDQGEHVVLEVELDRRLPLRHLPALVGEVLEWGGVRGPEEAGEGEGGGGG